MTTKEEQFLKNEHDAWYAAMVANKNAANIEYLAMMSDIEIDDEATGMMEGEENGTF